MRRRTASISAQPPTWSWPCHGLALACMLAGGVVSTTLAQQATTPAIADSPTAQTLFSDIQVQARENPAESARIARRLLDEYGNRVVKVGAETDDLFDSVSSEVERFLLANPAILGRFRDMESRAAERMLAEQGPVVTAARRRLTAAGLEATLRLAERAVRSDHALEALALLDTVRAHPDLGGQRLVELATLEAMARRRHGDQAGYERVLATLSPEQRGAVAAMAARTAERPPSNDGRSPLQSSDQGGDADSSWRQIWSLDLEQSLFRRVYGGVLSARTQRDIDRARSDARLMAALPTVLHNRIFVSEGHRIRAIDADSRDELWARDIGGASLGREGAPIGDLSAIAADDGALVVFEGHATASERTASTRVWCLDPATGANRWSTVIAGCDNREDLEGLFPVGAPLLVSDVVVIAARKPTQRLEQVDWLLALDRVDGHLRWASSVAGAPANRLSSGRKHAGLATDGSIVIDSTPLGVVLCARAGDGGIEWLRRFQVPLREPRYFAEPWEASAPVIVGDRVLTLTPDEVEVVALDRLTGRLLEARPIGPDTPWETPLYFASATASDGTPVLLGIGSTVVAFDARDLSKRLWSFTDTVREMQPPREGTNNRNGIRGRVSVAGQYVVVPGVRDILLLDLRTGRLHARIPTAHPSNPLLLSDRLVAAGDDTLSVIMPSERAESMLRARLAATPDDPSASIALLDLALDTNRPAVALDAASAVEQSIARGKGTDAIRGELIDKLVALAEKFPEQGDTAFALVSKVASTPVLRVRGELARGEYLRSAARPADAVSCWRALAADPVLLSQIVLQDGAGRQVRELAIGRIAQLASRDRDVAASLEAAAEEGVRRLGAALDAPALARLALEHPRTQALANAIAANRTLTASQATTIAVAAINDCLVPPARADLIDALRADLATRDTTPGHGTRIAAIDERVGELLHASGLERAELRRPVPSLSKLGSVPARGLDIKARMIEELPTSSKFHDRGLILGLLDGSLVRLAGPQLEPSWRLRLDDREPKLLWANQRAVLWQTINRGEDTALILDPESGAIVFATPRANELWPPDAAPLADPNIRPGDQPAAPVPQEDVQGDMRFRNPGQNARLGPGATMPSLVNPSCDGQSLLLVRRNGDVARIGVMDERPTVTLARSVIPQVRCDSLRDGLLTIGGTEPGADGLRAVVVVLDAQTLQVRARLEPLTGADVQWAFATQLGEVFVGTRVGIERWCLGPGGNPLPTLISTAPESSESERGILLGAQVLTIDPTTRPALLPVYAGAPRSYAYPDGAESRQLRTVQQLAQGVLLQADDRFLLLGPGGDAIGVDSNSREPNFAFAVPIDGALLQIVAMPPDADAPRLRYSASCIVERLSTSEGLRNQGGAFEVQIRDSRVNRVVAADGWLILSNSQGSCCVSLPP